MNTHNPPSPASGGEAGGEGKSGLTWLWLSALIIAFDQATKLLLIEHMALHETIPVTDFFNLVRAHNSGAAFSLLADQPGWQRLFFLAAGLVASGVIVHLLRKTRGQPLFCLALALILGGALGNVIDRAAYGYVVDFLDFYLGSWHWPAFNVADSGITVGAALLIFDSLRKPS